MADRLALANALAQAKIDRSAAERIATEIFDVIHQNVATKTDVELLRADLEFVKVELKGGIERVKGDVQLVEHRLLMRLGSLVVVVAGMLFAALRYLPPAH
ncbi:MAG: hypothetical protein JO038_06580 [Alphaproteobacteria bacterium]|nr:hypothetical protein [Alphaproteobacteria bacterium]